MLILVFSVWLGWLATWAAGDGESPRGSHDAECLNACVFSLLDLDHCCRLINLVYILRACTSAEVSIQRAYHADAARSNIDRHYRTEGRRSTCRSLGRVYVYHAAKYTVCVIHISTTQREGTALLRR